MATARAMGPGRFLLCVEVRLVELVGAKHHTVIVLMVNACCMGYPWIDALRLCFYCPGWWPVVTPPGIVILLLIGRTLL
jgi:hypothetical protein